MAGLQVFIGSFLDAQFADAVVCNAGDFHLGVENHSPL